MKNYVKPIVLTTEELAEGVYAASGDDCYTVTAYIHQTPQTGREDYRIQCNAAHAAADGHHSNEQVLIISFNQPVEYVGCSSANATLESGSGTNTLRIKYNYHNNANESIGLGELTVTSDDGLAIEGDPILTCDHKCKDGHSW